jgi:hypothetical protein
MIWDLIFTLQSIYDFNQSRILSEPKPAFSVTRRDNQIDTKTRLLNLIQELVILL